MPISGTSSNVSNFIIHHTCLARIEGYTERDIFNLYLFVYNSASVPSVVVQV